MNMVLVELIEASLAGPAFTPESLLQEHAMLVSILAANVGEEVYSTQLLILNSDMSMQLLFSY